MKTFIIGHQKPDTDAVVAALGLQFFLENAINLDFAITDPEAVLADPLNPETQFIFSKFNLTPPRIISSSDIHPTDQIILIDHNEPSQRLTGLDPDQIVEIIDHHKVNLNLTSPIHLTFKPWGSTSTIIYHLFKDAHLKPPPTLAALLLCGILSDTVGFKSSTCTSKDKSHGQELARLASIKNLDHLTLEIFKAKSDVSQLTPDQIVTNDYKIFDFGRKTLINQIETVDQRAILRRKSDLLHAMARAKTKHQVDLVFVAITDILKNNTKLLCLSLTEQTLAAAAFSARVGNSLIDIGPKLSRKKEIAPALEKVINLSPR